MQFEGQEESKNVEDRRGMAPTAAVAGGGGILVLILALVFGINPQQLAGIIGDKKGGAAPQQKGEFKETPEEREQFRLTSQVLASTEKVWAKIFREEFRKDYPMPKLVIFAGAVQSGCGAADSGVGPFYCPDDQKVYIDLSFYKTMERKLKIPGEFSRAYVVAHEVGHHVQRHLPFSSNRDVERSRGTPRENEMSVRLELQADFLAGVWAHHAVRDNLRLSQSDLESALTAAHAIGDDTLQKQAQGYVVPENFTHGSADQRKRWFAKGFKTGNVQDAKTIFEMRYSEL
jgi:uncharacterized protein